MANAREFFRDILSGGLPSAIDGIRAENNPAPEQTAPTGTMVDRIPGLNYFGGNASGMASQFFGIGVLIVAALGIVYLLRK
jgi:hypothetical protein